MALALNLSVILLMQETVPATSDSTTLETTGAAGGTTVYLAPEQMAELATQSQGNTAFMVGFLAFGIFCLSAMFWRSTGA